MKKTEENIIEAKRLREKGLSYREIGEVFGVKHGAVRLWLDEKAASKESIRSKKYYKEHRKEYLLKNKERIRDYASKYESDRRANDLQFRLSCSLRKRINSSVRRGVKAGSAVSDLGCTVLELRQQLESQFTQGMSWDNYGEWHIDHIKPLASFDLTDRDSFLKACHHTNLQPLWASDNWSKSDKIL